MSDLKYSNLGSEISDMVQKAIESQDFSQLSTEIQKTVGTIAENIVFSVTDEGKADRRPDYMKNAQHRMEAAQNPWKGSARQTQNVQMPAESTRQELYSPGGSGRLKGYFLFTLGIAGILGCMAGVLTLVIASKITQIGENAEITIPQAGYYGTDSKVSVPVGEINSNLENKVEGNCRIVTLTNTYTSYNYLPTKYYKKITVDIKSISNLQNVCIKNADGVVLFSKNSTGSFSYDITDYDTIIIASTAINGVAGTAMINFTLE